MATKSSSSTSNNVAIFAAGAATALCAQYLYKLLTSAAKHAFLSISSSSSSSASDIPYLPSSYVPPCEGAQYNGEIAPAPADSAAVVAEYERAVATSRARIPRWTSEHLKHRYCGLLYELNDAGFAVVWAFKLLIEDRHVDPTTPGIVDVRGYLRWRIVDVEPSVPVGTWMRYEDKIEQKWEADEVFTGKLDLTLGMLQTASHALRGIQGNPAYPTSHIAAGAYTFVLMQDGHELTGGYTVKPEHYSQAAASASINRCYAY